MKIVYPDFKKSLSLAIQYNITYYDASFVQIAKEYNVPLITEDKKLINAVGNYISAFNLDALKKISDAVSLVISAFTGFSAI